MLLRTLGWLSKNNLLSQIRPSYFSPIILICLFVIANTTAHFIMEIIKKKIKLFAFQLNRYFFKTFNEFIL